MSDDAEKSKGNFYYSFNNNFATFTSYVDLMTIIGWIYLVFTELSRNRDIPLSSQEKLKLNLNGAVELIKEDKHSENGKSMKKGVEGWMKLSCASKVI